ncbi:MAG: hypothetical protein A2W36_05860 [Chloroflexi bacterium RBG_16_58_14]|nr:MAG: hypothetical protein A2W36_05860 [Chloroflexi bacterium RBG_16_58_14]
MKANAWLALSKLIPILFLATACGVSFENPPDNLQESDLVGVWEAHYGSRGTDWMIIRADGTYQQIYDNSREDYFYKSPRNKWWLERLTNGLIRIHLSGGRYYLAGIDIGEREGLGPVCPPDDPDCFWENQPEVFYDPFAKESIEMVGELVLNVQLDKNGNLILHHMWTSSDSGFAIIGGEEEIFRLVDSDDHQ